MPEQWYPVFLILAAIGIFILFKQNRKYFWFALSYLMFSIPIATYVINANIDCNAEVTDITGGMAAVFYVPAYMFISVLIGIGFFYIISLRDTIFSKDSIPIGYLIAAVFVILACSNIAKNYKDSDMSKYTYPAKYFNNRYV